MTGLNNLRTGTESELRTCILTGANGLLGVALLHGLLKDDWRVAAVVREDKQIDALSGIVAAKSENFTVIAGDLGQSGEPKRLVDEVTRRLGQPYALIHAASPKLRPQKLIEPQADLDTQFRVNVGAFLEFAGAMLPEMLRTQYGSFIAISSVALVPPRPTGWQSYTIAKAALNQAVFELAHTYSLAGINAVAVLLDRLAGEPGRAGTAEAVGDSPSAADLTGTRAAQEILRILNSAPDTMGSCVAVTAAGSSNLRVWAGRSDSEPPADARRTDVGTSSHGLRLEGVFRGIFDLAPDAQIGDSALGELRGWDSLGHIKLIMEVEREFGVTFNAMLANELVTFEAILAAVDDALTNGQNI